MNSLKFPAGHLSAFYQTITEFSRNKSLKKLSGTNILKVALRNEGENIKALWEVFTKSRGDLPRYLQDPKKQALSYLLGWHLPNILRTNMLLTRMNQRQPITEMLDTSKNTHIIDLGCGTGAIGAEIIRYLKSVGFSDQKLSTSLYDNRGAFLDVARFFNESANPKIKVSTIKGDLKQRFNFENLSKFYNTEEDQFVIVMGYVWNEISSDKRSVEKILKTIESLNKRNSKVCILVLEPGNEAQSFEAMRLRDHLVHSEFQVAYPCPGNYMCPLLEEEKDWCFSTEQVSKPNELKLLDKLLGVNHGKIHSSAYGFYSKSFAPVKKNVGKIAVGFPVIDKKINFFEVMTCSENGIKKVSPKKTDVRLRGIEVE